MHAMVNGHEAEPGCYVDGHWGQYGPDHLADRAEEFGWTGDLFNDPRLIREAIDNLEPSAAGDMQERESALWEAHIEAADDIEQWLNDNTPPICPDCNGAMYPTSDGFYRHSDYANGRTPCGNAAIDSPLFFYWGWEDGDFYLSLSEEEDDE